MNREIGICIEEKTRGESAKCEYVQVHICIAIGRNKDLSLDLMLVICVTKNTHFKILNYLTSVIMCCSFRFK